MSKNRPSNRNELARELSYLFNNKISKIEKADHYEKMSPSALLGIITSLVGLGAAIGSPFEPGVGTVVGAGIGLVIGGSVVTGIKIHEYVLFKQAKASKKVQDFLGGDEQVVSHLFATLAQRVTDALADNFSELNDKSQGALIKYLANIIMKAIEDRAHKGNAAKMDKIDDICLAMTEIKGRKYWSIFHPKQAAKFNDIVKKLNSIIASEPGDQLLFNQAGDSAQPSPALFGEAEIPMTFAESPTTSQSSGQGALNSSGSSNSSYINNHYLLFSSQPSRYISSPVPSDSASAPGSEYQNIDSDSYARLFSQSNSASSTPREDTCSTPAYSP